MNSNPYEPGSALTAVPRTRATRWMILAGVVALLLAVFCLIATVVGMIWSYDVIATSGSTPAPSDIANGISTASLPSIAIGPLVLFGIIMLILGFVWRRPVTGT